MGMTPRERMLAALEREEPDHLPATTHHVMKYFLDEAMGGIDDQQFFDHFDLDAYIWTVPLKGSDEDKTWVNDLGFINSEDWQVTSEELPDPQYKTVRFTIHTPKGELTTVNQYNEHTIWVTEFLIKNKKDIDILAEYMPAPVCNIAEVNKAADKIGDRGLCRGHIICFDTFGQPGTWQDAACILGIEKLIYESYDDPEWVHTLLQILLDRKLSYIKTLPGARYDILELGGGDASTTVISPKIFQKFVAPYDSQIIAAAQEAGQRIVYHTCGGMMPILEDIADMGPNAMETFTPPDMGGDTDLAEAKRRIGDRVCMIGGFDQFHFFTNCTEAETRKVVRDAFEAAGGDGGFILSPSDHFFEGDLHLIAAFADEAKKCTY